VDIGKPTMRTTSTDERVKNLGDRACIKRDTAAWIASETRPSAISGSRRDKASNR